jgi:hypothetical protein
MFVLIATALSATNLIGWPCQRLNWGWRNVWSTCSINSYTPVTTTTLEAPSQVPTGFRLSSPNTNAPSIVLNPAGVYTPTASTAAVPLLLCTNAMATGTGATANLRNRCRRAIDAYGALVKTCQLPPLTAGNRGANALTPDFAPQTGHQPHVSNVQGLTNNAQFCTLPAGAHTPADLNTPSNTCPGLLGWFTVVFNACGFSNAPGMAPATTSVAAGTGSPWTNYYFPVGGVTTPNVIPGLGTAGAVSPTNGAGYFCASAVTGPNGGVTGPGAWNVFGTFFRTSRCRKALDQFGRTAQRCHQSSPSVTGPAQAGGYTDPLRFLAVGSAPAGTPSVPNGINAWAPACNA